MPALAEPLVARRAHRGVLVSAPSTKFFIGMAAAICAVFFPRLIAALTAAEYPRVTFVSREYFLLALSFSVLVAVAVMILEWRVPRAPRDTFMTTLGLPAMLAGALSASQGTATLQRAIVAQDQLGKELGKLGGIPIEPAAGSADEGKSGVPKALANAMVTPVYAEGRQAAQDARQQTRLGIYVEEPRYFIVLDRAVRREDAQARLAELTARINRSAQRPLALQVEKQGTAFLVVVSGGPRPRTAALLEALRLKDAYHIAPTLVEVRPGK
jgi:hypothetical protein